MTDKQKNEYDSLCMEVLAREEVVKKISKAQKLLSEQAKTQLEKRKARVAAACEYRNIEEAREAWGYDFISDKEFEEIQEYFKNGEDYILNRISVKEVASKILNDLVERLMRDISAFKREMRELEKTEPVTTSVFKRLQAQKE